MESNPNIHAWTIASEVELIYKSKVKNSERPLITSSSDAHRVLIKAWEEGKIDLVEQFMILLLNRANRVLGVYHVSSGGITGTVADPKIIFTAALKANAVALILTQKIKNAGAFLDIKVLDHLIVSSEGYYSFADEGLL